MSIIAIVHTAVGTIAISAGFTAFLMRKGTPAHKAAGNIFTIMMLVSAASGVGLGLMASVMLSTIGGVQVLYLVATSWVTVRRAENQSGKFEIAALALTLMVAGAGLFYGVEAQRSEDGLKDGFPAILYYIYGAAISFACALADITVVLRGGLSGSQRLARHLWRMGFAMYVATASFFLGQPQVFPEPLRGTLLLAAPVLLVIAMTVFWAFWVHIRFRRRHPSRKSR